MTWLQRSIQIAGRLRAMLENLIQTAYANYAQGLFGKLTTDGMKDTTAGDTTP